MRSYGREAMVQRYFYGTRALPLKPYRIEVPFESVEICQLGAEKVPDSCLPFGVSADDHHTKVWKINFIEFLDFLYYTSFPICIIHSFCENP